MMETKQMRAVFLLLCGAYLVLFHVGIASLYVLAVVKMLPVLSLWVILDAKNTSNQPDAKNKLGNTLRFWLQGGMILSAFGDFFMELEDKYEICFLGGLGSFLLAHVAYVMGFNSSRNRVPPVPTVGFVVFGVWIASILIPKVDETFLKIAVVVYMVAICSMGVTAVARSGSKAIPATSQYAGIIGSLLFVVSDAVLAFNKFDEPIDNAKWIVMLTYWGGQWGIAESGILA